MEAKSKFARRFDAEFKQNALALVQSGRSISEVARELGCSTWSLGRWIAAKRNGGTLTEPKNPGRRNARTAGKPALA
jgi:transposase